MAPLPELRTEVSVAPLGDRVYLLGGLTAPGARGMAPGARTLWVYHPGEDRWRAAGETPFDVHHTTLVGVNGRLYVLGGYDGASSQPTDRVHVYDPATTRWTAGPPMPTPRGALASALLQGRIHTIGGTVARAAALDRGVHNVDVRGGSVGTHEVFDPVRGTWERLPPMPTPRNHHVAGALDGVIVVSAGRGGQSRKITTTEIWDPREQAWRRAPPLPTGRSGATAAVLNGWLYVFGGEGAPQGRTFDSAERFSPSKNRWERLVPMPTPRHGLGAACVASAVYVISGGVEAGFSYGAANERFVLSAVEPSPVCE